MVCPDCKEQRHKKCPGETWCDCQHRGPEAEPEPEQ